MLRAMTIVSDGVSAHAGVASRVAAMAMCLDALIFIWMVPYVIECRARSPVIPTSRHDTTCVSENYLQS